ncbi:MAG: class I SAM-dependent methyltransferase [Acidimicrobiales bacterium]
MQADALALPVADGGVDGVTCGFALRNLVDLRPFFAELGRAVRPGGRVALLEVAEPPNPLLRVGHAVYFGKVVPLIGGALSDKAAYRYLPKSVAYLPEPDTMLRWLGAAGFVDVHRALLSTGIAQLITATRARRVDPVSDSAGLVARTRRLDADVDLLDVAGAEGSLFCRDGIGLAGVGVAATVTVTDRSPAGSAAAVDAVLSAIDTDDRVGLPGADRSRSACCRSCPTPPAPCACPRCSSAGPTTAPAG